MRELWFWRMFGLIAVIGWAWTAASLPASRGPAETVGPPADRPQPGAHAPPTRDAHARYGSPAQTVALPPRPAPNAAHTEDAAADGEVTEAALELAREEVRQELAARREAHDDERLDRGLAWAAAFAAEHDLSAGQLQQVESALTGTHDRIRQLHAEDPLLGGGPPPEAHREQMRGVFDQLDADLRTILGDDLAASFREGLGPGRPPGGGPPSP